MRRLFALFCTLILALSSYTFHPLKARAAVTRDVCQPAGSCTYDIIQDAIDDAGDGDTILVGPGIYDESLGYCRY